MSSSKMAQSLTTTEEWMQAIDASVECQLAGGVGSAVIMNILGPPAIGKTQKVHSYVQWKYEHGSEFLGMDHPHVLIETTILAQQSNVDFGMPAPNFPDGSIDFLISKDILGLSDRMKDYDIVIQLLDEATNADPQTLTAVQSVLEDGVLRGVKKADNTVFMLCGNRPEDGCNSRHLPTSLMLGRLVTMNMGVNPQEWLTWAKKNEIDSRLIAANTWASECERPILYNPPPERGAVGPTPRGYQKLSNILRRNPSPEVIDAMAPGCIGQEAWMEVEGFIRMASELPQLSEIINNPYSAVMPGDIDPENGPSGQYAVVSNMAFYLSNIKRDEKHLETKVADAFITYLNRMPDEIAIFGAKLCADADERFTLTSAFGEMQVKHKDLTLYTGK